MVVCIVSTVAWLILIVSANREGKIAEDSLVAMFCAGVILLCAAIAALTGNVWGAIAMIGSLSILAVPTKASENSADQGLPSTAQMPTPGPAQPGENASTYPEQAESAPASLTEGQKRELLIGLSDDEKKVLELVSEGLHNLEIADRLGISPIHASLLQGDLRAKFGVGTNAELIEVIESLSSESNGV